MASIEEMITEINDSGWLIGDCYQTEAHKWRCWLRREGDWNEVVGDGRTLAVAMMHAMTKRGPVRDDAYWNALREKVPDHVAKPRGRVKHQRIVKRKKIERLRIK